MVPVLIAAGMILILLAPAEAQVSFRPPQAPSPNQRVDQVPDSGPESAPNLTPNLTPNLASNLPAEAELQTGIALTRRGLFLDAIPHLVAARGQVSSSYAAGFNLALCYVGTSRFPQAIQVLHSLPSTAEVNNLLAQAYVGNGQPEEAAEALQKAADLTPKNEKLYLFVADACMDHRDYALGLKVVDLGLGNLPQSARLHYQRGMFLSLLDQLDLAKPDFDLVSRLAPESDIAFAAAAQENMLDGDIGETIRVARGGIQKGHGETILLSILGEALLRSGVVPGQPGFVEAKKVLEQSVTARPNYPGSQIALGKLYLMEGRVEDALIHLETARQLDPRNPSAYAQLTKAYRLHREPEKAQAMLAILARLNQEQAETIRSAPGDVKTSYSGPPLTREHQEAPHPQ
jgi:tetratricopeptide (TPR) repeat protein